MDVLGRAPAATKAHRMEMMSGEARVGPWDSLTKPVMMEASRTKKHRPGIHRSRKALFMSMLAPLSVVLNWMVEPQMEVTARHSALMYVHLCQNRTEPVLYA